MNIYVSIHIHCSSLAAMDVSSDLTELGRTPVAVISAGVKSILDIPRTLEYLVFTNSSPI
jgi:pseudouridine-5'-phosphate glycosidase